MSLELNVNERPVAVADGSESLLEVLRRGGDVTVKDGCSPQGQCGCCTVLVDGKPRVACVTPARRVAGRSITTLEGLDAEACADWGEAFLATGGSQCGFCTPGIIVRLEGLRRRGVGPSDERAVEEALKAHLCRCTGWRTILDAYRTFGADAGPSRSLERASGRASLEGRSHQSVSSHVALGGGGFADDLAPPDALVVVPDGSGGWSVGETVAEARETAGKVQGRRSTEAARPPLALPPGDWDAVLRTTWIEPGYLETDASWCHPGGEPADPLANGGAFGGKVSTVVTDAARRMADEHGRAVRVLLSREDCVRLGAKRPPVAGGVRADGSGHLRVVETAGIDQAIAAVAPGVVVEQVRVPGPPTSVSLRGAGWVEAAALLAAASGEQGRVTSPDGAVAEAALEGDHIVVRVRCGDPLDEIALRSYCIGAAHMATSWVTSESLAVDEAGEVHDLTIRSFGILRAVDMPPVDVEIEPSTDAPVNGSDAVFAAVASAVWAAQGNPTDWPTGRMLRP